MLLFFTSLICVHQIIIVIYLKCLFIFNWSSINERKIISIKFKMFLDFLAKSLHSISNLPLYRWLIILNFNYFQIVSRKCQWQWIKDFHLAVYQSISHWLIIIIININNFWLNKFLEKKTIIIYLFATVLILYNKFSIKTCKKIILSYIKNKYTNL